MVGTPPFTAGGTGSIPGQPEGGGQGAGGESSYKQITEKGADEDQMYMVNFRGRNLNEAEGRGLPEG